jgi:hypothetical protein
MAFYKEIDERLTTIIASLDDLIIMTGAERAKAEEGGKASYRSIQRKLQQAALYAELAQKRAKDE